jgi:cytochrome c oxidase subunit II
MKRVAPLVLLAACGRTDWLGDPSGPGARWTASLGWVVIIVFCAVCLAVWALIGYLLVRKQRGSLSEHMPWNTGGGKGWLLFGGVIAPGLVFAGCFIASVVVMDAVPVEGRHHMHGHARADILVIGHQWWWEVRYLGDTPEDIFTTANEIHIPAGRPVTIELQSRDVIHSFWIPELHGKVDLIPGRTNTIEIEADVPGRYEGQCAEYCGEQHALMRMAVVADDPARFKAWRFEEHEPALHPHSEPAIAGEQVFEQKGCAMCHTIRGTRALATIGPDLTHVASRAQIGANSIPNAHAYLAAWIVRAQSLKPDIEMPNLDQLTGDELTALVAYLRGLQ